MCCTRLAGNTGRKMKQKSPSAHHRTTFSGCIFATKACIDNRKKLTQQYLLHKFSQYGELRPTRGCDRLGSLGHPSKFQPVSRLAFVTAATSLIGGQPNFAGCLVVYWAGTLYIQFRGSCPVTEFCRCKIHFTFKSCVLPYWQRYCTALQQRGQPNFAAW